ncbi:hypothetical protein ACFWU5_16530 [Nocardia sp. NPDC058640]
MPDIDTLAPTGLLAELEALAHDLRWDGHTAAAARAQAIANKYGASL